MKIFFDTEFADRGTQIELLSLGAVREDGKLFYAENLDADLASTNEWVQRNVIPHFTGPAVTHAGIARGFKEFVGTVHRPEFWAYYGTYDMLLLIQLFGGFMNFPWNQVCHDLNTLALLRGVYTQPVQISTEHNALNDALWNKQLYEHIMEKA